MLEKIFSVIYLQSEIAILMIALVIFGLHNAWDYWSLKRFGTSASPFRGNLIEKGQDSTFGVMGALIYVILVIAVTFVIVFMGPVTFFSIKYLLIGTLIIYIFLAVVLNIWGKKYLIANGYDPKPDGYKGTVELFKETVAKEKEKQRKKKEESLF